MKFVNKHNVLPSRTVCLPRPTAAATGSHIGTLARWAYGNGDELDCCESCPAVPHYCCSLYRSDRLIDVRMECLAKCSDCLARIFPLPLSCLGSLGRTAHNAVGSTQRRTAYWRAEALDIREVINAFGFDGEETRWRN